MRGNIDVAGVDESDYDSGRIDVGMRGHIDGSITYVP
jgi:hypothetical protein